MTFIRVGKRLVSLDGRAQMEKWIKMPHPLPHKFKWRVWSLMIDNKFIGDFGMLSEARTIAKFVLEKK